MIFFKGQIKCIPEITFRGHVLVPFDTNIIGSLVMLTYTPDTKLPKEVELEDQLYMQGYTYMDTQPDGKGNTVLRCMRWEE